MEVSNAAMKSRASFPRPDGPKQVRTAMLFNQLMEKALFDPLILLDLSFRSRDTISSRIYYETLLHDDSTSCHVVSSVFEILSSFHCPSDTQ